jgi:choline dehydrogenase-like flavoprotein
MPATAKNEVIVCGGAIDTPKLLLNGIGPRSELEALNIDVKVDLPGVGKHLKDHVLTFMSVEVAGSVNAKYAFDNNPSLITTAQESWTKDQTGAFALHNSTLWGGFLKLPDLETYEEYAALPPDVQEFLSREKVPTYEFVTNSTLWPPGTKLTEGNTYVSFLTFLMNPQSSGSVTLRSANASDKPVIALNYLTHPFDMRVFREAVRNTWQKMTGNPAVAPHIVRPIHGPKSMDDADVDWFVKENANTVWHACGTCKMGRDGDVEAVVDKEFRVRGVDGLRVVDMSVAPVVTNNHTQPTAYLIAQKAAEKMVEEYGLDRVD